jgi:hypothetical protein
MKSVGGVDPIEFLKGVKISFSFFFSFSLASL